VVPYYFRGQGDGRWVGRGTAVLDLSGRVERRALGAALRGCDPGDGHFLPAWKPARRRAGWDLTLAAPKSLSILAALTRNGGDDIAAAHANAIDEVVGYFERQLLRLRRGGAPGGLAAGAGLVGAAFEHSLNASGEPHLHTHLIVCNLGRDDSGVWSAISSEWWTKRGSLGAIYQLGLRYQLRQRGLDLEWQLREDGFADVVGVPRAAVRSASGRGRAAAAAQAALGNGTVGRKVGIRATAGAQTRLRALPRSPPGCSGFGSDEATRLMDDGRARRRQAGGAEPLAAEVAPEVADAVSARVVSRRSWFRQTDVLVALAACAPAGLPAATAELWSDRFCAAARRLPDTPGRAPRWTNDAAVAADLRLLDCADQAVLRSPRSLDPRDVAAARRPEPGLVPAATTAALELLSGNRSLHILSAPAGRTNLLAQAAVLEVAGAAWQAAGWRVGVLTSSEEAFDRWRALTGFDRYEPGCRADVVVVDSADRRSTADLLSLLVDIEGAAAQAVLIEGGSSPRLSWRHSTALASIGERFGRIDPGPPPAWTHDLQPPNGPSIGVYPTARQAVGHLLRSWSEVRAGDDRALMVGLGYAETDGLNEAGRALVLRRGELAGPSWACGSRVFQAGDRAVALRRLSPDIPAGTFLGMAAVDPRRQEATVTCRRRTLTVDRAGARHLGYGYAATPALAAAAAGPLVLLGDRAAIGAQRARVVTAAVVGPPPALGLQRAAARAREQGRWAGMGLT
jgi:conjugative relaxase-like TrwC/TraI family protein